MLNMRLCRKPVKQSFISTIDEIHFIRIKIVQKVRLNKPGSIKNEPLLPISFRSRAYNG